MGTFAIAKGNGGLRQLVTEFLDAPEPQCGYPDACNNSRVLQVNGGIAAYGTAVQIRRP